MKMNLVGFNSRKLDFQVKRYLTGVIPTLHCKKNEEILLNYSFTPSTTLRFTLISDIESVLCTLSGNPSDESLALIQMFPTVTSTTFSKLTSLVCDKDCDLSIYAPEEVSMLVGTVEGALYADRRALGTDELNRVTIVSTEVLVCAPKTINGIVSTYDLRTNDLLVNESENIYYSVLKVQKAFDRKGSFHHWELDVISTGERE